MRSGQLSVRRIRKLGSAMTIKGKSLIKADLDSCERTRKPGLFYFSGRRLEMNIDSWPAEFGSMFASTATT